MTERKPFEFYREGDGADAVGGGLPDFEENEGIDDPAIYVASAGLRRAVDVAVLLGQPLLVTGDPGTGKTQLAAAVAHRWRLPKLDFYTKTTSTAKDLFYHYDALSHFHDAQFQPKQRPAESYINFEALGIAILLSMSPDDEQRRGVNRYLPGELRDAGPLRSVVLIDEIDKASRDFPNDVLNEIEQMAFAVKELKRSFKAVQAKRPVIIMTSNSERNLPEAFLRRCVFYHIAFPETAELKKIVKTRLGLDAGFDEAVDRALHHFEELRAVALKKQPATAELLAWVDVLMKMGLLERLDGGVQGLSGPETDALALTYSVLAKNKDDIEAMKKSLSSATARPNGQ